MNYKMISTAVLVLCISSCAKKTEAEIVADFKQTETQACITSWKSSNTNGASDAMMASVCGCSIDTLVQRHPIEKLQQLNASNDRAELESTMLPIVQECAELEMKKSQ